MGYKKARLACYTGYVTQAIVVNLAPLLFVIFQKDFNFSLSFIAAITLITFLIQMGIDIAAIYAKTDVGLSASLPRDKKHLFALMTRNENAIGIDGKVEVDTFSSSWQNTGAITEKILECFPNSSVVAFHQFPNSVQMCKILSDSVDYVDVVFITFAETIAYTGPEHLTRRAEALINAAQSTGRVAALIHYGNPCVLENLVHIPRVIIGGLSERSNIGCIDVVAGNTEAKGVLTYKAIIN